MNQKGAYEGRCLRSMPHKDSECGTPKLEGGKEGGTRLGAWEHSRVLKIGVRQEVEVQTESLLLCVAQLLVACDVHQVFERGLITLGDLSKGGTR